MESNEHVLPYADVQLMGSDAVIAKSRQHIVGAREWHKSETEAARSSSFKNKRVITSGDRDLGAVKDVYVNEQTGIIEAYDVAGPGFTRLVKYAQPVVAPLLAWSFETKPPRRQQLGGGAGRP